MTFSEAAASARNRLMAALENSEAGVAVTNGEAANRPSPMTTSDAHLDVDVLLAHVTGRTRSALYAWPDTMLTSTEFSHFTALIDKRAAGYPVAYLVGQQEFWSLPISVTPDVLIPRPETELLVETALTFLQPLPSPRVLELGTGSGAIAIALASEMPGADITATDVSAHALQIAGSNADKVAALLGVRLQLNFLLANWFTHLETSADQLQSSLPGKTQPATLRSLDPGSFNLIVSNPPYLADNDPHLGNSIRYEPRTALVSGSVGLESITHIIKSAGKYLNTSGMLALEHGYEQAESVRRLLIATGYTSVTTHRDLATLERVTTGLWSAPPGIDSI